MCENTADISSIVITTPKYTTHSLLVLSTYITHLTVEGPGGPPAPYRVVLWVWRTICLASWYCRQYGNAIDHSCCTISETWSDHFNKFLATNWSPIIDHFIPNQYPQNFTHYLHFGHLAHQFFGDLVPPQLACPPTPMSMSTILTSCHWWSLLPFLLAENTKYMRCTYLLRITGTNSSTYGQSCKIHT